MLGFRLVHISHFPCGVVVQFVFMHGKYLVRLLTVIGATNSSMAKTQVSVSMMFFMEEDDEKLSVLLTVNSSDDYPIQ